MPPRPHTAIFTDNASRKDLLARALLKGTPPKALSFLCGLRGGLFSSSRIQNLLEEEARHDQSGLTLEGGRRLASFSSGERKKALWAHLLKDLPDFLILDNPFENLDRASRDAFTRALQAVEARVILIQFLGRAADLLPMIQHTARLEGTTLEGFPNYRPTKGQPTAPDPFPQALPPPPDPFPDLPELLVEFRGVDLTYQGNPVLQGVDWQIRQGEFWELKGPNGSGKTSLITLITGDNPKVYGQEVFLFGMRRGSGESVWEVKAQIGYFTPGMTDRFRGHHMALHMLVSGLTDSIGLYVRPTDKQRELARAWLQVLGLEGLAQTAFQDLTEGQKRLLMCARAMIKHPPLLILDEPTTGLDDPSASLLVSLVRKMAAESRTAIVFVSHRQEPGLEAPCTLELIPGPKGARAVSHRPDQRE